jgi:hypothetical protein
MDEPVDPKILYPLHHHSAGHTNATEEKESERETEKILMTGEVFLALNLVPGHENVSCA